MKDQNVKQKEKAKTLTPKKSIESVTPELEKVASEQKRKQNWQSFRQREGPRALGSKEIPEGGENCLEGLTFVQTGEYLP